MAKVLLKKSSVSSNAPGTGDLDYGELAINYADGRLYYKNSSNEIKHFIDSDAVAAIIAAGATGLTEVVQDTTPQLGGALDTNGNNITFGDNDKAVFGAGSDLQIFHDGANSYIQDAGTGSLVIRGSDMFLRTPTDDNFLVGAGGASVTLYYNNAAKFATTATGIDVTGNIIVSGTVDGRDVAADGTKLDGIESGATADQTITAGAGLTGGGTGDVTLNIGAGTGVTVNANDIAIGQAVGTSDNVTFNSVTTTGNMVIGGNLQVTGTTTTVNSQSLEVTDNMIYMNAGESDGSPIQSIDVGWAANVNDGGSYTHVGMFRDATDDRFKVFGAYTPEPDAALEINTGHASFALADFQAATFHGALSGNATTASTLQTARTISLGGDVTGSASFNGGSNITITATVANDSHTHDGRYYTETEINTKLTDGSVTKFNPSSTDTFTGTYPILWHDNNITPYTSTWFTINGATDTLNVPNINLSGNVTVGGTVDGRDVAADGTKLDGIETGATADQTITAGSGLTGGGTGDVTLNVGAGSYITVAADTVSVDATSANTASKVVARDASGNFSAGTITAALSGNATTASTLQTSRTIALSGDVTGSASFNGGSNITITATVANDSHTHDGRYYTETEADSRFFNVAGDTVTGDAYFNATSFWRVSAADTAAQRADARDDATNFSRLHWYGISDTGGTSNFRHAWYDGANYINVTANASGRLDFTGSAASMYIGNDRVFDDGYHPNADKWTTARTLTLNGDASGSVSWDGSANATLTVTVADDSHNHIISNVDGLQTALNAKAPLASPALTGTPTAPTATAGTNTTQIATTAFVSTAVSNLVDAAPTTLDTLNELAAALGDDPNFATTVTNSIGTKVAKSGDTMTGQLVIDHNSSPMLKLQATNGSPWALELGRDDATNSKVYNGGGYWSFEHEPRYYNGGTPQKLFHDGYHPNADKWTTARTLTLTGAVTGSASIDGSGNVSLATTATSDPTLTLSGDVTGSATFTNLGNATLTATVADDSHNHSSSSGNFTVGGDLTVSGAQVYTNSTAARVKLSVWSNSTYGIGMESGYTYGGIGNDYVMSFQMSNTDTRGFWWGDSGHTNAQGAMALTTDGKLTVADSVRIGFGQTDTTAPGTSYTLQVNGSFAATTKSFVIDHPTKEGMKLRHGSLEGPEDGVYVRGRLKGNNVIELPDYWLGLVHEDTITVNLTAIGKSQDLYVEDIINNKVIVSGSDNINCFYTVFAERKDVDRWAVEYEG